MRQCYLSPEGQHQKNVQFPPARGRKLPGELESPVGPGKEGRNMATGTVKWFSSEKGYDFISQRGGPDVFVHYKVIQWHGYRTCDEDEPVEVRGAGERHGFTGCGRRQDGRPRRRLSITGAGERCVQPASGLRCSIVVNTSGRGRIHGNPVWSAPGSAVAARNGRRKWNYRCSNG